MKRKVDKAKDDGLWTSTMNVYCKAGWYELAHDPPYEEGDTLESAVLEVTWRGVTQTKTIYPGIQDVCADTDVAVIVVNSDGTFTIEDP